MFGQFGGSGFLKGSPAQWVDDLLPLVIEDLSTFARALHRELQSPEPLGHVSLLNRLSRAAGFRNLQHLRHSLIQQNHLYCCHYRQRHY